MNAASNVGGPLAWNMKYNPFYLLSAACMLLGCLLVTNSLSWTQIPLSRLLILIGTLNVYEATLIALAIFLIRRRQLRRDGFTLLVLEAFFLLDITFLNAEIVTGHLGLGIAINVFLFLMACAKLGLIWRILGRRIADARFVFVLIQLTALFAVPTVLRWIDHGWIPDRTFYFAWWIIAGPIPLGDTILRRFPARHSGSSGMITFFTIVPWLSIVLHLSILHYVYGVTFFAANAAPLILAIAIVLWRAQPANLPQRVELELLSAVLPVAAIVVSLQDSPSLSLMLTRKVSLTSLDLSIAGTYLTYVYLFAGPNAIYFLSAGVVSLLTYVFGPTSSEIQNSFGYMWLQFERTVIKLTPSTALTWGATAIGAAFVFLGLGATLSLRRGALPPPDSAESPSTP